MDQDAFRKLLSSRPNANAESSTKHSGRGSLLPSKNKPTNQKNEPPSTAKPEFKPRKVRKPTTESAYRDRAAERRLGKAGDFAQAEALLEDFQKRHADDEDKEAVEKQRSYLGGDAEHTVLVKGLDFALLEQAKARAAAAESGDADELLEAAFRGEASPSPPPTGDHEPAAPSAVTGKKRTREEILRELKSKRSEGSTTTKGTNIQTHVPVDKPLEDVRKDGKFKPIGFKPIASNASKSKSKSKDDAKKEKEGRKKKKRKVEEKKEAPEGVTEENKKPVAESSRNTDAGPSFETKPSANERKSQNDEPPPNDDFDIFADAGEYEGINLDDDDDESDADGERKATMPAPNSPSEPQTQTVPQHPRKRWFNDLDSSPPPERPLPSDSKGKGKDNVSPTNNGDEEPTPSVHRGGDVAVADNDKDDDANENGGEAPLSPPSKLVRLAPLASSAVPSIRDILAADEALEAEDKRRARKEKRKAGGGGGEGEGSKSKGKGEVSSEAKLNRDYQRLQAYTKKKGESS